MRKYLAWILIVLCAFLPTVGTAADNRDTQLTTTLPHSHTITVICGEGGAAYFEGMSFTGTAQFVIDRLEAFVLEAVPDVGYRFSQVEVQPGSGVKISGNTVIIDSVYEEKTIKLKFVPEQIEPTPTTTPTAEPTAAPTAEPTAAPTAEPTAAPTAEPTATATAEPTATPTVSPTPVLNFELPQVISQGNVLYDKYLGTGKGLSELGIVYDEVYEVEKYELLAVKYVNESADENLLLAIASPDEEDKYGQHSLILSGMQLARLWQENEIEWIELRNGDAGAMLRVEELISGNIAKLIHAMSLGESAIELGELEALPDVELGLEELAHVRMEVRIVPPSAAQNGYVMNAYLWSGDEQLRITELLESFHVCLTAEELSDETEREAYVKTHSLIATKQEGEMAVLPSELLRVPTEVRQELMGAAEYFAVTFETEDGTPVVLYDPVANVEAYCRYVMCATWPGDIVFSIAKVEDGQIQ